MSNRFHRAALRHENLRNFLTFFLPLDVHTRRMNVYTEYSCSPLCQTNYEITEEIKRTRAKRGFLERVDRRITLLPRIDPRQLPISPSFSTLQFGKSFREFEATFSSFLSLTLSAELIGPCARLVQLRSSNHDSIAKLSYSMACVRASECLARSANVEVVTFDCREIRLLRNDLEIKRKFSICRTRF